MEIQTSCNQTSDCQACLTELASKVPKPRAILTEKQAVHIFELKQHRRLSHGKRPLSAAGIARVFSMNEKTVSYIWKGRTWSRETWHLDCSRQILIKQPGKPKGCKDTKQRQRRISDRQMPGHEEQQVDRLAGYNRSLSGQVV